MKQAAKKRGAIGLFSHKKRVDWGVSVLSGEQDGKRRYLFEGGEERVMGPGGIELMIPVEQPDDEQRAAGVRLTALLAKREGRTEAADAPHTTVVIRQLDKLHKKYRGGFFSKEWRSDEKSMHARQTRTTTAPKLQAALSPQSLEERERAEQFAEIWGEMAGLLGESRLATGKLRTSADTDALRALCERTRELLHGGEAYETRFDRFVEAYEAAFREPPSWQTATALSALMNPVDHVYVEPASFRKQLKSLSLVSTLAARPTGAAYARCLGMAKALANMLAARGEVPRDLLDVHDFVRVTA